MIIRSALTTLLNKSVTLSGITLGVKKNKLDVNFDTNQRRTLVALFTVVSTLKIRKEKMKMPLQEQTEMMMTSKVKEKNYRQTPLNLQMVMPMESKSLRRRRKV